MSLFLMACWITTTDKAPTEDAQSFFQDGSAQFSSPTNGAVVQSPFGLELLVGNAAHRVELKANNEEMDADLLDSDGIETQVSAHDESISLITAELTLAPGNYALKAITLSESGESLSNSVITITVEDPLVDWVTIVSPTDGQSTSNPVQFLVNASDEVETIEIFADDWSLGTTDPGQLLSYTFSGTGFPREIEARALINGEAVASHAITITVEAETEPVVSDFNDVVMGLIDTYPTDGSYGYHWPSSGDWEGTTQDIYYLGEKVASGDSDNQSYCVGLTWEVFMRAWSEVDAATLGDGSINGMAVEDLLNFRTDWYVRDLYGAGPADAVENYGIGEQVTDWADVQPGDFIQFWRNSGSGHNTIFIDWETTSSGEIIGLYYWSTQGSTDGIGYKSEYFGNGTYDLDPQYFYAARVYMPVDWVAWY